MSESDSLVYVVDDDPSVRRALERLLKSVGLRAETFGSAQEFLDYRRPTCPACLVLDIRLPGQSGMDLQQELTAAGVSIPIIFITGHGDIPLSVRAMKAGAVDFLPKPFNDQNLLDGIEKALEKDRQARLDSATRSEIQQRVDSLTPREREVLELVITGMLNKQIAYDFGISEKTIKVHRARVFAKMKADSLPDLVRLAEVVGIRPPGE